MRKGRQQAPLKGRQKTVHPKAEERFSHWLKGQALIKSAVIHFGTHGNNYYLFCCCTIRRYFFAILVDEDNAYTTVFSQS